MAYDMTKSKSSVAQLRKYYNNLKGKKSILDVDLDSIFGRCCSRKEIFPVIKKNSVVNEETYINAWIDIYIKAKKNMPSKRISKPKQACSDPAVLTLVKENKKITQSTAERYLKYHELFMEAENCVGELLEEYIYLEIKKAGADIAWCIGKCVKSVDFCTIRGDEIQIKNKYNTENSSSKKAREDLNIDAWYRIKATNSKGLPIYNWDELNQKFNQVCPTIKFAMDENGFQKFLKASMKMNKKLIQ